MDYLQYYKSLYRILEYPLVLNLIINGLPSISFQLQLHQLQLFCFKPYYKWITFNILIKGIDIVFIIERINFYMVAKFNHFSTPQRFLFFYIKILV